MKKIYLLALTALSLTACESSDDLGSEPVAVRVSASIGDKADSRAVDQSWTAGDKIGVSAKLEGSVTELVNLTYTTPDGDGEFTHTPILLDGGTRVLSATAYYPFSGTENKAPGTSGVIKSLSTGAAYQTREKQPERDFMFAEGSISGKATLDFTFAHKMCKLTLILEKGNDGPDVSDIKSIKLTNLYLNGSFDTSNGDCTYSGSRATLEITDFFQVGSIEGDKAICSFILFPQKLSSSGSTLTVKDNHDITYTCSAMMEGSTQLVGGNNYRFFIKLNRTGMTVSSSSITDWKTSEGKDATAE